MNNKNKRYGSRQVITPVEGMGISDLPEEYKYSSASYYIINKCEWDFIADYDE